MKYLETTDWIAYENGRIFDKTEGKFFTINSKKVFMNVVGKQDSEEFTEVGEAINSVISENKDFDEINIKKFKNDYLIKANTKTKETKTDVPNAIFTVRDSVSKKIIGTYPTVSELCAKLGLDNSTVYKVLNGKISTTKGYTIRKD